LRETPQLARESRYAIYKQLRYPEVIKAVLIRQRPRNKRWTTHTAAWGRPLRNWDNMVG